MDSKAVDSGVEHALRSGGRREAPSGGGSKLLSPDPSTQGAENAIGDHAPVGTHCTMRELWADGCRIDGVR